MSKKNGTLRTRRRGLFEAQNGRCFYCGWPMRMVLPTLYDPDACTVDHLTPVARGGNDSWDNLVACCNRCNEAKDDLTVGAFLLKRGLTRPEEPLPQRGVLADCELPETRPEPVFVGATTPLALLLGPALAAAFPDWVVENGHARPPQEEHAP